MKRKSIVILAAVAVTFVMAQSLPASNPAIDKYTTIDVQNGGTLAGKVIFSGPVPKPKILKVGTDTEVCGHSKTDESLVVDPQTKGIQWAVVYLKNISAGKDWKIDPATLAMDQLGCQFKPHVLVVPVKQTFYMLNSDGVLHNVHTRSKVNRELNKAQPKFMKKMPLKFNKPEIVQINCDVHNWMRGWVVVAPHPYYAVTAKDGSFQLTDIPPGTYEVEVWHETLGTQVQTVEIKAGQTTTLEFKMAP